MDHLPLFILIIGVAGSGKTEIGKLIAKQLCYVYLDKDTLTRPYTEKFLEVSSPTHDPNDRESSFYLDNVRPLEYSISLNVAEENLRIGNSVVVSAPFLTEAKTPNWINREILVGKKLLNRVHLKVVLVVSDRPTERKRLIQRGADRDKWKLYHWEPYTNSINDFEIQWDLDSTEIFKFDNREVPTIPFNKQMEELVKWIKN